jgi:tetratricopeptide (TPR) repeat protein
LYCIPILKTCFVRYPHKFKILPMYFSLWNFDDSEENNKFSFYFNEALRALNEERYETAISFLDLVLEVKPDHFCAHGFKANIYNKIGQYEKALEELEKQKALRKDDFGDDYSYDRGIALQGLNRHEEAIKEYHKYVRFFNWAPTGYILRAKSYFFIHQYTKCIRDLKRALRKRAVNERDPSVYLFLGAAFFYTHRYKKALSCFARSLKFLPESGMTFFYRGLILFNRKKWKQSIKEMSRAEWFDENYASQASFVRLLARLVSGKITAVKNDIEKFGGNYAELEALLKRHKISKLKITPAKSGHWHFPGMEEDFEVKIEMRPRHSAKRNRPRKSHT